MSTGLGEQLSFWAVLPFAFMLGVPGAGFSPAALLTAISCGAVMMGALTYIGNAPNFAVRGIAEDAGVAMPSFLGYMKYSLVVLLPVFAVVTAIFFL